MEKYKNDEKDNWNSYDIYQKNPTLLSSDLTYFDLINDNIKKYNENFINTSKNVNNKSIPIYDLNRTALKDLYIIKLFNQDEILNVLKENNTLKVVVTNTTANWYVHTDYFKRWKKEELSEYFEGEIEYAKDFLTGGLYGPVTIVTE